MLLRSYVGAVHNAAVLSMSIATLLTASTELWIGSQQHSRYAMLAVSRLLQLLVAVEMLWLCLLSSTSTA